MGDSLLSENQALLKIL